MYSTPINSRTAWLALGFALLNVVPAVAEQPKVKVFLLAGQSNMFGKGEVKDLTEQWLKPQEKVWIWQDDRRGKKGWTSLRPGFGNSDSNLGSAGDNLRFDDPTRPHRFGPELSLGRALANAFPESRIALIKHAMGGTDVWSDWNPDWNPSRDGDYNNLAMYAGLRSKVSDATSELNRLGLDFELAGMFWSQGARDAKDLKKAKAYEVNLRRMIKSIRRDYGAPRLSFVLARQELIKLSTHPHVDLIRTAHDAVVAHDPYATAIPTEDIADTSSTDNHWNAIGQLDVGERYADGYLRLVRTVRIRSVIWTPNDPEFFRQTSFHNVGQTGGTVDADIDALEAWQITTGSMRTVVGAMDTGLDYTHPDLYLNIWLNEEEIPAVIREKLRDVDGDGLLTFRDLNAPANADHTKDLNGNGFIDGGDLLADPAWENGRDEDGNGFIDDLVGWDCCDDDNDAFVPGRSRHGTAVARHIGAMGDNGLGGAGLNWKIRMVPIRVSADKTDPVPSDVAAAFDYAVSSGASIVAAGFRGSPGKPKNPRDTATEYSKEAFEAIKRTQESGLLVVAAAGNGARNTDINPWYPQSYDVDNVITVAALSGTGDQLELSSKTNWGKTTVEVASPTTNGTTSHAIAVAMGVAALIKSRHPDWTYRQIKRQMMETADPVPALAGKIATGGRLNVARAIGYVFDNKSTRSCFSSRYGPIDLPDARPQQPGVSEAKIQIDARGKITDLDVRVDIRHPRIQDLKLELVAPDGSVVLLFEGCEESNDVVTGFLDKLLGPVGDAHFSMTVFDDDGDEPIETGRAPYDGFFRPKSTLQQLNSKDLGGTWKLQITDRVPSKAGRLIHWAIIARYEK